MIERLEFAKTGATDPGMGEQRHAEFLELPLGSVELVGQHRQHLVLGYFGHVGLADGCQAALRTSWQLFRIAAAISPSGRLTSTASAARAAAGA